MRLRAGETLSVLSAVALAIVLTQTWFETAGVAKSGWSGLGWFMVLLLGLLIALSVALAVTTQLRSPVAWPIALAVFTSAIGIIIVVVLALRILTQPDLGVGASNAAVDVRAAALFGFLLALLIPVGSWLAMGDERTDSPDSAYEPPEPRPLPDT